jgi:hypothetical protein
LVTHWQRKFGDGGFVLLKEDWLQGVILNNSKLFKFFFKPETSDTLHGKPKNQGYNTNFLHLTCDPHKSHNLIF